MLLSRSFSAWLRNRLTAFVLLSAAFLWLMRYSGKATPFLVGVAFLIFIKEFQDKGWRQKEYEFLYLTVFFYSIWVLLSFAMHFTALRLLTPDSFITVSRRGVPWGIRTVRQLTQIYMFFPVLYAVAIFFFRTNSKGHRWLCILPILFIPSMVVGLYQGLVNNKFYNQIGCPAPGLSTDCSAFGIIIYLFIPICILGIVVFRSYWKKLAFALLIPVLLKCVWLTMSITAILGILVFVIIFPFVWIWVNRDRSRIGRFKLMGVCLFSTLLLIGIGYKGAERPEVRALISNFKEGGIALVIERHNYGRFRYGRAALGLTMSSPVSGWGPGGFYRNLHNYEFKKNYEFKSNRKRLRIHNTANHYLQMSSELGLVGAFFNIFLHVFPLWMIFRVRKRIYDLEDRWAVGIVFATVVTMMLMYMTGPHGMALDVVWVFVVLLAFLFTTALRYGYSLGALNLKLYLVCLVLLTCLFGWGTYQASFGPRGYQAQQQAISKRGRS